MLPCKAQNVQPSVLVGMQKEDTSNDKFVAGVVLGPGLTSEEGGLLGERCCGGMLSLFAGRGSIWKDGRERGGERASVE